MTFQARHTNVAFPKQETVAFSKAQRTGAFDGFIAVALNSCAIRAQHFAQGCDDQCAIMTQHLAQECTNKCAIMTQHLAQGCSEQCAIMTQHLAQGSQRVQIHTSYFRYC